MLRRLSPEELARSAATHPWRTIAAWLGAIVLAVVAVALFLGAGLTTEGQVTNDPQSVQAQDLLAERFPEHRQTTELVIVRSDEVTVDDPVFAARVQELAAAGQATGVIAAADSYFASGNEALVSEDRRATLVPIRLTEPEDENVEEVLDVVRAENERDDGFDITMTGQWTTARDFTEVSQHDLEEGELKFGLPAALLVLVLVFGALVAAFLPLLLAIVSIIVALGLTALLAQGFELSIFVVNMLIGMGLALGIDYALFVVSRFREERRAGLAKTEAIVATGGTASRAVLFSGTAFVLSMTGLLLVQSTIMRSLAAGAILVGLVSVAAAATLLPALLSIVGDRVNSLRVPIVGRGLARQSAQEGRFWGAIVQRVIGRPALSFSVAAALLLAAAAPVVTMNIGAAGIETLPDRLPTKQGFLALEEAFPTAGAEPAEVVVDGPVDAPEVEGAVERLQASLAGDPAFGPPSVQANEANDLALVTIPVAADPLSDRAVDAVERLREDHVPAAFDGVEARALVGGTTALNLDYFAVMDRWLPIVLAFVLSLSFLLLLLAFRSVVVAATAIVLNLLSVGAAYGLVVAVFQHGVGAGLFGFRQVETIEAWVPLFLFAVLFGLSMDYQVFLLSRIRERYTKTGDNRDAVVFGISSTARIITGAALIIVAVFSGFAAGDLVMFQQMGFGVAVALLIDATIVRSVLVPSAMQLLGDRNWYLPSWLERIPNVSVEGPSANERAAASGSTRSPWPQA